MQSSHTITHLMHTISDRLAKKYENDPTLATQTAWWLIQAVTGTSKAHLIAHDELSLTHEQLNTLERWLVQLLDHDEPLAYIIGSVPFGDVIIETKPPTLIPRPETEEWIYALIHRLTQCAHQDISILDLCTGSGCIAVALAHALPKARITATDISHQALQLASHNAQRNNCTTITFIHSDLFNGIAKEHQYDLIVSNPPYISQEEWETLDASVKNWEDKGALVADDQGYALIDRIINEAPDYIKDNAELKSLEIPQLLIEVGYNQARVAADTLKKRGYTHITIEKDVEGKERVITARVA